MWHEEEGEQCSGGMSGGLSEKNFLKVFQEEILGEIACENMSRGKCPEKEYLDSPYKCLHEVMIHATLINTKKSGMGKR